jgi:hypothetical protein
MKNKTYPTLECKPKHGLTTWDVTYNGISYETETEDIARILFEIYKTQEMIKRLKK